MESTGHVALEITLALIKADPNILKNNDPKLIDRRITAAFELFEKVTYEARSRTEKANSKKTHPQQQP